MDCPYFHIVTTVPSELNEIFLYNSKICYEILFKATSDTILALAKDTKWLGAKVGITSVLHTWVLITILKCIEMKENYQYKKTQSKKIVNLN